MRDRTVDEPLGTGTLHEDVVRTDSGVQLAYQVGGNPDGPVCLLLGGRGNSHKWWTDMRRPFDEEFRTVTFDYRGTGASADPGLHYLRYLEWSSALFARDAALVLDALGVRRAAVYGQSFGSSVAQHLAATRPDLVGRLVLAGARAGGAEADRVSAGPRSTITRPAPVVNFEGEILSLLYTDAWRAQGRESHLLGDMLLTPEAARAHLRASTTHNAYDLLPQVQAPTLVLHGESDPIITPANGVLLAERIAGARFQLMPGRHAFFDEFSHDVSPIVVSFLLDTPLSAPVLTKNLD